MTATTKHKHRIEVIFITRISSSSWKFFNFDWNGATPGEHTITSRATDSSGYMQPTAEGLAEVKKTFLEQNNQYPRTVMIA